MLKVYLGKEEKVVYVPGNKEDINNHRRIVEAIQFIYQRGNISFYLYGENFLDDNFLYSLIPVGWSEEAKELLYIEGYNNETVEYIKDNKNDILEDVIKSKDISLEKAQALTIHLLEISKSYARILKAS